MSSEMTAVGTEGARSATSDQLDEAAWVARHAPYVAAVATRMLGFDGDVDDVVQDVFMQTLRKRDSLRDPRAVRGWLATITVRRARWVLRRRKLRAYLGFDEEQRLPGPELFEPATSVETWTRVREVYRVLDRLPIEQRLAWTLRHVEGEKLEDVARLCSTSLATAKRRIERAQATLRKELGHV